MITGLDADDLARMLFEHAAKLEGTRITYKVDQIFMQASVIERIPAPAPLLTGCGGPESLAATIHSFHQWGQPIHIGVNWTPELFQFWVERDSTA
ncbi:hypothetical protein ACI77O_12060 [Pseudomonas tritici]|uniref:hypothetical protein n=1 Tax=Pseudomonas tritici TaxID=2745518 RepID=UPI00387AF899